VATIILCAMCGLFLNRSWLVVVSLVCTTAVLTQMSDSLVSTYLITLVSAKSLPDTSESIIYTECHSLSVQPPTADHESQSTCVHSQYVKAACSHSTRRTTPHSTGWRLQRLWHSQNKVCTAFLGSFSKVSK